MAKRELQIARMLQYFIDATVQIINEEGIENVTIRKIANIAGYNSATIYNYFKEVSHLIFFASIHYLKNYADALPAYMNRGNNAVERYLLMWECFCKYSFQQPKIYFTIFASNLGSQPEDLLGHYYDIFPEDLDKLPEQLKPMFLEPNLLKRGEIALNQCIEEGYFNKATAESMNEIIILIWHGMLTVILNNRRKYEQDEAVNLTMNYINEIVFKYMDPHSIK
jgi:AcrR family transcriptional regulator